MKPGTAKPRVGISRCLLGDAVRYDGRDKYEPAVVDALSASVEWVSICPEVEVGMGVPREPIELVAGYDRIRLLGVVSATDWTDRMRNWSTARIDELREMGLSGFVLKSRSPSCGLRDVAVRNGTPGRGMFADALLAAIPDLVVEDEERLRDPDVRDTFLRNLRNRASGGSWVP